MFCLIRWMGIKTEKTLILIQIVLLIGVAFISLFTQIAQNEIDNRKFQIIGKQNELIGLQNKAAISFQNKVQNQIAAWLGAKLLPKEQTSNSPILDDMYAKFNRGEINSEEFKDFLVSHYNQEYVDTINRLNKEDNLLNELISNEPKCFSFNCTELLGILFFFQMILILVSLGTYIFIFNKIGKKYITSLKDKNIKLKDEIKHLKHQLSLNKKN